MIVEKIHEERTTSWLDFVPILQLPVEDFLSCAPADRLRFYQYVFIAPFGNLIIFMVKKFIWLFLP